MKTKYWLWTPILLLGLVSCTTIQDKPPEIDKNDPEYIYQKAVISMQYDLVDEAIKYLQESLSRDPAHFPSLYLMGVAALKKGDLVLARSSLEKAVELKPENPDAHAYLANVYQNLGLMDEAEQELIKTLSLDENFDASFNLARLYFERNLDEKALEYIQKSISINSRSAAAYNLQGVIFNKQKKFPEAILSFQNALRIDNKDYVAGLNLAVAYINNNERDKAQALLDQLQTLVKDPTLQAKIQEYLDAIKK